MAQIYGTATDFDLQKRLDAERYEFHYPSYIYWQRYYTGPVTAVNGVTSDSALREFTWPGGDVSPFRVGGRLRVLDGLDAGEYGIVEIAPGGDNEKITVDRDWPIGGQVGLTFFLEMDDLYGDQLPAMEDRYVQRPSDVPLYLRLDVPKQELTKFGFDEDADGVVELSRGLLEAAPHVFVPKVGDIIQAVDSLKYEMLTVKPWDWVGAQHDHWLHYIASVQRTHRDIPGGGVPAGTL